MDVQVIGLVRFSVLTDDPSTGWRIGKAAGDDAAAALFDEARLARRFAAFEALTLPSLDAQQDRDFQVVVLTSTLMPPHWMRRLEAAAAARPHLVVRAFAPDGGVRGFARKAVKRLRRPGTRLATFRLDDDDALGRDYVAALRREAAAAEPGAILSAPEGVRLRAVPAGGFQVIPTVWPNIALGLARVTPPEGRATVFSTGNHTRIDPGAIRTLPTARPSWIYAFHDANDSATGRKNPFEWRRHRDVPVIGADALRDVVGGTFPGLDPDAVWRALTA